MEHVCLGINFRCHRSFLGCKNEEKCSESLPFYAGVYLILKEIKNRMKKNEKVQKKQREGKEKKRRKRKRKEGTPRKRTKEKIVKRTSICSLESSEPRT